VNLSEPITGLEAATSGVKLTVPTFDGTDRSVFIVKTSKFGWFRMLKNSPRSCSRSFVVLGF
jgi:hypothetical protein